MPLVLRQQQRALDKGRAGATCADWLAVVLLHHAACGQESQYLQSLQVTRPQSPRCLCLSVQPSLLSKLPQTLSPCLRPPPTAASACQS